MAQYVPGQAIVVFHKSVSKKDQKAFLANCNLKVIREFVRVETWLVAVPEGREQGICDKLIVEYGALIAVANPNRPLM